MRKKPDQPAPSEQQLRIALKLLREECDVCRHRLRKFLSEGQDTQALRVEIAARERRMADITMVLDALAAEAERKEAAGTTAAGAQLAQDATTRIATLMASLEPHPHPVKRENYDE